MCQATNEQVMTDEIKIFVYGSCHFSERLESDEAVGNGGYGIAITVNGVKIDEISGGFSQTTNARMDIFGITEGLKKIKDRTPGDVIVFLSNGYVIDSLTKGWLENWKRKGFKKKKHVDLWISLDKVLSETPHTISFKHSKEVKFTKEFQLAEQLGKEMSGKKNLTNDLNPENNCKTDLFAIAEKIQKETAEIIDDKPILESIAVDASTIQNPGPTEYRGVDTKTRKVIFSMKLEEATNNIGEFLAIVHALAHYKKKGEELKIIYSDSVNAISWVKQKKCKTKYERTDKNEKVFDLIQRAVAWLETNEYDTKILKWNTGAWGEIPADYGRK
jgi:ribonuclease HI